MSFRTLPGLFRAERRFDRLYIGDVSGKDLPASAASRAATPRFSMRSFEPATAHMRIVSAGMPGPLLLRANESQVLQVAGLSPGLFPAATYDELTVQLQPGDNDFGIEGIQDVCRHAGESPLDLLGHLFSTIQEFTTSCRQWDDMSAAYFHFAG